MIAAFLGREFGAGLLGDEVAEGGLPAFVGAVFGGPVCYAFAGLGGHQ